eukprot:TRINITY_DN514_c0_g1_i1.p1 TRINITY_DN514_c0_g1~~TRINITY_DN514_c0_g1_i1.p1  ORF type:complete len:379 (+),score=69.37 TRINITY_DN514_c0_g1_i1:563-1699(+)
MELEGRNRSILEVEYFGEVGTGLGPTLEFFTLVCKEVTRNDLKMWWNVEATENERYVHSKTGLFPAPIPKSEGDSPSSRKVKDYFKFLGTFIAKALLDKRLLDIHLSRPFYKWMTGQSLNITDLLYITPTMGKILDQFWTISRKKIRIQQDESIGTEEKARLISELEPNAKIESMCIYFTLPGNDQWELCEGGSDKLVTLDNLDEYIDLVASELFLTGVGEQLEAFRTGFGLVFPMHNLSMFKPDELELILAGSLGDEDWGVNTLLENLRFDHGFNHNSRAVRFFVEVLSELSLDEKRKLLLFVTGCPKLPVGGFKSLNPKLTVVKKDHEPPLSPDDYLPSVMTCVNYVKLPDYSSKEVMRKQIMTAAEEGLFSFHLS